MKKQGYQIKYGENIKHISFKKTEMNKAIRGKSIGEDYTEENIKNRVNIKTLDLSKLTKEENSSWEKITINKKLIKDVTDDHFYTKVPFQKLHIKYDMAEAVWKNENTILVKIDTNRN